MNPLQELIRSRMAERHWTFADVARRGRLPRSTVHHLARNERPSRSPHPQTLQRLAAGLELPADQVHAAAAASTDGSNAGLGLGSGSGGSGGAGGADDAGPGGAGPAFLADAEVVALAQAFGRLGPEDRHRVRALVETLSRHSPEC